MFAKMEFLGVQFEEFDSQVPSSSPSANGKDAGHPKVQVVTVYEGQIVECSVKITNCSKVPVSVATIECKQPRNSGDVLGISVDLMESALEDALPMAVGGTVEVPISLKVECSRAAPSVMSPLPLEVRNLMIITLLMLSLFLMTSSSFQCSWRFRYVVE